MKTVFVNPERCIGCRQCEFACAVEHSESRDPVLAVFESTLPRPRIHVTPGRELNTSVPNRCRHCNPAPCERVCPTGAVTRDDDHDVVLMRPERCIACAMCAMVCPFDAVTFHEYAWGSTSAIPELMNKENRSGEPWAELWMGAHPDLPAFVELQDDLVPLNELIAEGRAREANAVLTSAARTEAESARPPAHVGAWRGWGAATTDFNEGVSHGHD